MKFDSIRLTGSSTVTLPLYSVGPDTSYVLVAADGLGPTEVTLAIAKNITTGGYYQSKKANLRQVSLRIGLNPDWEDGETPESLRTSLYSILTPRFNDYTMLELLLNGAVVAQTSGQISKCEVSIFTKDPEVLLTLDCVLPYLYSPSDTASTPAITNYGGFSPKKFVVVNSGTAPTGFVAHFKFNAATTGPIILSADYDETTYIQINRDFDLNEVLIVDTRPGSRGIYRENASGDQFPILQKLDSKSLWLDIYPGSNTFYLNTANIVWDSRGFVYNKTYLGV